MQDVFQAGGVYFRVFFRLRFLIGRFGVRVGQAWGFVRILSVVERFWFSFFEGQLCFFVFVIILEVVRIFKGSFMVGGGRFCFGGEYVSESQILLGFFRRYVRRELEIRRVFCVGYLVDWYCLMECFCLFLVRYLFVVFVFCFLNEEFLYNRFWGFRREER